MADPKGSEWMPNFGTVTLDAATATITNDAHAGKKIILNRAAGIVVTLPAATGSGAAFEFYVQTSVTSNAYDIRCPSGSEFFGHATIHQDGGATLVSFDAADNDTEISMNGSTTGGLRGARIKVVDLYTGHWHAEVYSAATGTEATPFTTIA